MNHSAKAKVSAVHGSLRKVAAALRPTFPAWIDSDQGLAFPASIVTPRVRDILVLRLVERKTPAALRHHSYAHGGR